MMIVNWWLMIRWWYWAVLFPGVLLYGPPGTGKTLLARACAAQTKSTFLKLAGPQLVQMFIGDGAKLVRDAFALAKEKNPAIIFIDELDAIGNIATQSVSVFICKCNVNVNNKFIERTGTRVSSVLGCHLQYCANRNVFSWRLKLSIESSGSPRYSGKLFQVQQQQLVGYSV